MAQKAVDIVLLPTEEVMEQVIGMNRKLKKENTDNLSLRKHDFIPHISLAMGVIDEEVYSQVEKILGRIQKEFSLLELEFSYVNSKEIETGDVFSAIVLENTGQLQKLHEQVIKSFRPVFKHKASKDKFYSSGEILESTVGWVNDFESDSSFENFLPHISVGFGKLELEEKLRFTASKLAVCHLGKFCTCRDVLLATQLE